MAQQGVQVTTAKEVAVEPEFAILYMKMRTKHNIEEDNS